MRPITLHRQRFGWGAAALLLVVMFTVFTLAGTRQVETPTSDSGQFSQKVTASERKVQAAAAPVGDDGSPDRNGVHMVDQATDDWRYTRQSSPHQIEPAQPTTWTVVDDLNTVCD